MAQISCYSHHQAPERLKAAPKLQAAPAEPVRSESKKAPATASDKFLTMLNYGVGGAGTIAGTVAIPHQVVKNAPWVMKSVTNVGLRAALTASTKTGLVSQAASGIAKSSIFVVRNTDHVAKLAAGVMRSSTVGRLFSPKVANVMTGKVLPTANAVGAGISVLDNGNRLYKAYKADNVVGQAVAGTQIALNVTGAVTGYLPGRFQLLSAAAGITSLGLEVAHQLGGVGK